MLTVLMNYKAMQVKFKKKIQYIFINYINLT